MPIVVYVGLAVVLIGFGYLALFSIGLPFLLTGVLMLGLASVRRRRETLVPALVWPWAFTVGYVLVAPLGCSATNVPGGGGETTRCDAVFLTYAGDGAYSAPLLPAAIVGLVSATVATLVIRAALRRREREPRVDRSRS